MTPRRIQLSRRRGWRMPPGTVKADRTTLWGNPFVVGRPIIYQPSTYVRDRRHAASLYRTHAPHNAQLREAARVLRGYNLACWCRLCDRHRDGKPAGVRCPDCEPCHVDTLLTIANPTED